MLAGGYGGWWFDMWGGWFSDPRLLAVLGQTQKLGWRAIQHDVPSMKPQVCVVVDEELSYLDASFGTLAAQILRNRYALGKSGTPYDLYLRSDILSITDHAYRAVWLLGPPELTRAETEAFKKWLRKGMTIMWTRPTTTTIQRPFGTEETFEGKIAWSGKELRDLWRTSGAHIYLKTDDVLYAGRGWIGIHTVSGGRPTIRLPFTARIEDAFEGKVLAESADRFQLDLPSNSTILLQVWPQEAKEAR
jgi:beta-galactosidase